MLVKANITIKKWRKINTFKNNLTEKLICEIISLSKGKTTFLKTEVKKMKMFYYVMSYNPDYSINTEVVSLTIEELNNINTNEDIKLLDVLLSETNVNANNLVGVYTSNEVNNDKLFANKLYRIF
jgi:hypothetical protein